MSPKSWWIYTGTGEPDPQADPLKKLPAPPPWRTFDDSTAATRRLGAKDRGETFQISDDDIDLVNAALFLRRPLLITGKPGTGKSTLAYSVARELKLGTVLRWSITTRATLQEGLYRYDALARLQAINFPEDINDGSSDQEKRDIGNYIQLGPLGTALYPSERPRVLLIDEIDKSDIDLPNDLLNIFEEGEFEIPELSRLARSEVFVRPYDGGSNIPIPNGRVHCTAFPIVVMTSNGEREFPPAFLRRCIWLDMAYPNQEQLKEIVKAHLGTDAMNKATKLIEDFVTLRDKGDLATDQLLNAIHLATSGMSLGTGDVTTQAGAKSKLLNAVLRYLKS